MQTGVAGYPKQYPGKSWVGCSYHLSAGGWYGARQVSQAPRPVRPAKWVVSRFSLLKDKANSNRGLALTSAFCMRVFARTYTTCVCMHTYIYMWTHTQACATHTHTSNSAELGIIKVRLEQQIHVSSLCSPCELNQIFLMKASCSL